MVCWNCRRPLHPEDVVRLFVNNGRGGMEERSFCDRCGTSLRHGSIPVVPLTTPHTGPEQRTGEPGWYRLINA